MQPVSTLGIVLLRTGFVYSMIVSWLVYHQTGKQWMLYLPQWIDASSGVTRRLRIHGMAWRHSRCSLWQRCYFFMSNPEYAANSEAGNEN